MSAEDPIAGAVLGKYRLLRVMGEGGMAIVFEAEHTKLGQKAAVKVLRAELAVDPVLVERFEREGRAISKLKSRNVVRVLDVDETPSGVPYLVMEMLDGWDLEEEVHRRGALPVGEAVHYMLQACNALSEAHQRGLVHRDIKPSNLFLTSEGDSRTLKVLDFGIAKDVPGADVRLTGVESVMGTPLYMAPEQFRATRDVDARADVWALGATLYELLTGRPPFTGTATTIGVSIVNDEVPNLREARSEVPEGLAAVVYKALEKDRNNRYLSATQFADALAVFSVGVVIAPRASSVSLPHTREMEGAQTQLAVSAQTEVPVGVFKPKSSRLSIAAVFVVLGMAGVFVVRVAWGPATATSAAGGARVTVDLPASTKPPQLLPPPPPPPLVELTGQPPAQALPSQKPQAQPLPSSRVVHTKPSAQPSASSSAPSQPPLFFPGQ